MPLGAGYAGPAVANGKVFVMDRTKDQGEGIKTEKRNWSKGIRLPEAKRVVCFDLKSGKEVWAHPI